MEKDTKPLEITSDRKESIKSHDLFIENKITVKSVDSFPYLIFCYQELNNMYGINSDDVNLLLYLKELRIFDVNIRVLNNKISLRHFLKNEYIINNGLINNAHNLTHVMVF